MTDLTYVKAAIAEEITKQLYEFKAQIMAECEALINKKIKKLQRNQTDAVTNAVTSQNDRALVVQKETEKMILAVGMEVQKSVYNKVMTEINTNVMPKVERVMDRINYHMEDGDAVVDSYRREVEKQSNPGIKRITDGKKDDRIITAHVRTFFGEDNY
jgi:hypothetical protein